MATLLVLYRTPADPAAFDRHYTETHVPLAKALPGLRRYELSEGPVVYPGGSGSPYHRVATLTFDSVAAIHAALSSAEGAAAATDVGRFAQGGAELLIFDNRDV